ncbi:hypothetical protein [Cupriavidus basilensis]|uniref:hypothetical protein n=1 Tax=Cupriavidus basilensis TaxID=68895 RepID=UPI0020A66D36|nr:hypothetical protein [Cupriavidus basilensis]MCP3017417.1 hypothetical protein [Cupriavidus basilensis]
MTPITLPETFNIDDLRRTVNNVAATDQRKNGAGFLSARAEAHKAVLQACVRQAKDLAQLRAAMRLMVDAL